MSRRVVVVVLGLLVAAGVIVVAAPDTTRSDVVFSRGDDPGTPRLVISDEIVTVTWFCGGTSALGRSESGEYGGEVVLTNTTDSPSSGTVTVFSIDQQPLVIAVDVAPRSQAVVDLDEAVTASYVSSMVEVDRSEVSVEQISRHPAGDAVSTCTATTSDSWYVADGFTAEGSDMRVLVTNPYPTAAIVDVEISTAAGPRTPDQLQGYVVPPRSLRVLNMEDAGFRDEPVVAVNLRATTGRVVVAKDQHYLGAGRLGHVTSLASPAVSDEWWFADGRLDEGVTERLIIFNPTDDDVEADVVVLGVQALETDYEAASLTVPSREVVTFDVAGVPSISGGSHALLVTALSGPALVVERVITEPAGQSVVTSSMLGLQGEALANEWFASVTAADGDGPALVILNVSPDPTSIDVSSFGPGGPEPVADLTGITLQANERREISLGDVAGRPISIVASDAIVVERLVERNESGLGRLHALALPVRRR